MKPQVKLGLYILTALGTLIFGILFVQSWRRANTPTAVSPPTADAMVDPALTNDAPADEVTPEAEVVPTRNEIALGRRGFGMAIFWGLLAIGSVVGLGALAAYDIAQYAGQRATQSLFDDEGEDVHASTYEQVEEAYGKGEFLEAIGLLREFLKENPRGIHAQIRIAEIYEKDLNNPVAAALEYEEVLKHSFEAERKGWTCIHLVNLYNRLGKRDQAIELMQRIVVDFPDTPASAKARERLAAMGIEVAEPPSSPAGAPPQEPPSNLPPGFRPK